MREHGRPVTAHAWMVLMTGVWGMLWWWWWWMGEARGERREDAATKPFLSAPSQARLARDGSGNGSRRWTSLAACHLLCCASCSCRWGSAGGKWKVRQSISQSVRHCYSDYSIALPAGPAYRQSLRMQ